ncbi:ethylene-responsive transcription factor ERF017-like [Vicia villosa]|uniref:ethylene-responsive transcription factor ERF017-like n=1 Tax=Vicia villosa TaxID=3911 RepID=UPI00273CE1FA|nr:ethylene-responsive transcription factor ERF017-like [Vicia villosa]
MLIQINYTILQMDITTDHVKGKTPSSSTNSSGNNDDDNNKKMYRGVRKRKWGKWVCEIRLPNSRERIWLGSYDSPEKAARAFDAALYCLRGRHATFNFPDTPFLLDTTAVSNDPQQIREIAANFANKTPPIVIDGNNNSNTNNNNNTDQSKTVTEIIGSSSSTTTTMHDNGGNSIDWTFLDVLDGSSNDASFVGSENYGGFYSDLEKMNSGELFSLPQQLPLFEDNIQKELVKGEGDDDVYDDDPFSHQPFLWNWDF